MFERLDFSHEADLTVEELQRRIKNQNPKADLKLLS